MTAEPTPSKGKNLLEVRALKKHFPLKRRGVLSGEHQVIRAVDGVDFFLQRGETLGLVGESGSGKSTAARAILQLYKPTSGSVRLDGIELTELRGKDLRRVRRRAQMIFQDPYASLDPRMTVQRIIGRALLIHDIARGDEKIERVHELLGLVGLNPASASRYPHEFSGGQRQRIGIARALAVEPEFIIADEPTSALDVSIQAQIINLLEELQEQFDLTYLLIAHDLSIVHHTSDRVAVMYLGRIVESASNRELFEHPRHPYTQALLSAIPSIPQHVGSRSQRIILKGDMPNPANPPSGCRFRTRCFLRERLGDPEICLIDEPDLTEHSTGHWTACHFAD